MSLEDLNERLHSRDTHLEKGRLIVGEEHTPEEIEQERQSFQKSDDWQTSPKQEMYLVSPDLKKSRKKKIFIAIGVLVTLCIFGGASFAGYTFLQRQNAVSLEITGPNSVASAERVGFDVKYKNSSFSETKDNVLIFTLPENFQIEAEPNMTVTGRRVEIKVGNVLSGAEGKATITGKFYGGKGEKEVIEAILRYTPKSSSSQFESKTSFELVLATSPLLFEIDAPSEIGSGQELDYVLTYQNKSTETFRNLRVVLVYPEDFQYLSATIPSAGSETEWYIGELKSNQSGKIVIHGILSGNKDTAKTLKATIGILQGDNSLFAYDTVEKRTQITASPLTITQVVNENTELVANPGDTLNYVITYKNTSSVGMRDVIITETIDTTYLDVSKLRLDQGAYDDATKKITWRVSDISALSRIEPGQGGTIKFSIPVAEKISVESNKARNLSIQSIATIDSPDVKSSLAGNKIIGSNLLKVKVGALVVLSVNPYYGDTAFPNTGPVPPVVGSETTYTIKTKVESSSNDLSQTKVSFVLPSGVVYKEKSSPGDETVTFNSRTNELIWEIGTLAPRKEKVLQFQVAITPNSSQIGKDVELVRRSSFYAKESFTKKEITTERGSISNNLTGDNTVPNKIGSVLEK